MKKHLIFFLILIVVFLHLIVFVNLLPAQSYNEDDKEATKKTQAVTLPNPLGEGNDDPNILIGKVINAVLGIVGSLALVMFIYGGFTWMLAAGNQEKVQKGKDILIWATIGLIVIFSAYALVKFIFTGLGVT